jgi:hypothetical protein
MDSFVFHLHAALLDYLRASVSLIVSSTVVESPIFYQLYYCHSLLFSRLILRSVYLRQPAIQTSP